MNYSLDDLEGINEMFKSCNSLKNIDIENKSWVEINYENATAKIKRIDEKPESGW